MFDSSQHMCVQWEVCVKIPFQQAYVMSKNSFDSTLWTSLHTDRQHVETWVRCTCYVERVGLHWNCTILLALPLRHRLHVKCRCKGATRVSHAHFCFVSLSESPWNILPCVGCLSQDTSFVSAREIFFFLPPLLFLSERHGMMLGRDKRRQNGDKEAECETKCRAVNVMYRHRHQSHSVTFFPISSNQ